MDFWQRPVVEIEEVPAVVTGRVIALGLCPFNSVHIQPIVTQLENPTLDLEDFFVTAGTVGSVVVPEQGVVTKSAQLDRTART